MYCDGKKIVILYLELPRLPLSIPPRPRKLLFGVRLSPLPKSPLPLPRKPLLPPPLLPPLGGPPNPGGGGPPPGPPAIPGSGGPLKKTTPRINYS